MKALRSILKLFFGANSEVLPRSRTAMVSIKVSTLVETNCTVAGKGFVAAYSTSPNSISAALSGSMVMAMVATSS